MVDTAMMWVFAILVVLAMGVVAMLAAGRGEPMRPAYDDRRDVAVPADRPLGSEDLERVRFSVVFRGYRMSEVDALLARLTREMSTAPEAAEAGPAPDPESVDSGEGTPTAVRHDTHGR